MFQRILVPYDDSDTARLACTAAMRLARKSGAKVRLVHHLDMLEFPDAHGYGEPLRRSAEDAARAMLAQAQADLKGQGDEVETELRLENGRRLGASIADAAAQWACDLVVLGSHGRRGIARVLLGSGAEQIVRESPAPSLVVRGSAVPDGFGRILVATDGSETSLRALVTALQLAREHEASVRLFHSVGELGYVGMEAGATAWVEQWAQAGAQVLADAAQMARSAGVATQTVLATDFVGLGTAVAREATAWQADLVAVGTHGRRGLERLVLGSGAEQVMRESPVSVLVVPPARERPR